MPTISKTMTSSKRCERVMIVFVIFFLLQKKTFLSFQILLFILYPQFFGEMEAPPAYRDISLRHERPPEFTSVDVNAPLITPIEESCVCHPCVKGFLLVLFFIAFVSFGMYVVYDR